MDIHTTVILSTIAYIKHLLLNRGPTNSTDMYKALPIP